MSKLLKSAAIAALITGFANVAVATPTLHNSNSPQRAAGAAVTIDDSGLITDTAANPTQQSRLNLSSQAVIGVARIDGGRLIPTPFGEEYDWELLDRRLDATFQVMNAGDYLKYTPEYGFDEAETVNKIDEIRLTAANEGLPYVLIYGVGPDAHLASFGGKALKDTGLTVHKDCESWTGAKSKALLVDSFSGEVLGAVTANNIEFNIGELADGVGDLVTALTST